MASSNATTDIVEIQLTRGYVAAVDAADYPLIAQYSWRTKINRDGRVYATTAVWRPERKNNEQIFMHRLIVNAPKGTEVDHVDGDGLNNRRSNLRLATKAQNQQNKKVPKKRAVIHSSYKGVVWHKRASLWFASIKLNGKQRSLGYFKDEKAAALAYDRAARELFGTFARCNFDEEAS